MRQGILLALLLGAAPAMAEDVALVVGNGSYDNARGLRGADDVAATAVDFSQAGFRVFAGEDLTAAALRTLAGDFAAAADGSGRIVIALAGHFAESELGAWFLGSDTQEPDLISVATEGLSLATLYEIAARAPGRAVVILGTENAGIGLGAGLETGTGRLPVPQGVAVIRGDTDDIADMIQDELLRPGTTPAEAVSGYRRMRAEGYVTDAYPFLDAWPDEPAEITLGTAPADGADEGQDERLAWARALAQDTREGYQAFLDDYPDSPNADSARAAIARLEAEAGPTPEGIEEALGLSRDQRRAVQQNLTLMGYDTRGVDGIFGRGSRRAIGDWQKANGRAETGYLDADQVALIDQQAAVRRAERAEQAAAEDAAAWQRAQAADSVEGYRAYLSEQPEGAHRDAAQARLRELLDAEAAQAAEVEAAMRAEERLGLTSFTRRLVESRLDSQGFEPGPVDGEFDDRTRRALREYQAARDLPVTGYVDQDTMSELLADTFR